MTVRRYGFGVLACGLVVGVAMAVPARGLEWHGLTTIYQVADGFFLLLLFACGLLLTWRSPHRWITQAAALVGGTVAALLAGAGLYAAKHWRPAFGSGQAGNLAVKHPYVWLLVALGAVVALAAASAAVLCLLALHSTGAFQTARGPAAAEPAGGKSAGRPVLGLAVGGVVLVGLPIALATQGPDYRDITSLVAAVVQYSLPWGVGLALAGWLERRLALVAVGAVAATVALFALVRLAGLPFAWTRGADLKIILLVMLVPIVAAALVAATRGRLPGPRPLG